jgi:hypothetical protein
MSALASIRDRLFRPARDMVCGRLEPQQVHQNIRLEKKELKPNQAYVSVILNCLRIKNVGILWHKLYGVVYSFIQIPIYQTEKAEFNVVTTPDQLKNINASNLQLVIQRDILLLNSLPYRGGRITAQMGLFAVESDNLMDKYLALLSEISAAAGVSSVRQALPFVGPITKGIDLVLGVSDKATLQVGLYQYLEPIQGHFVVTNIDSKKTNLNLKDLTLDENYRLCKNGELLDNCSYLVFSLKADEKRDTWFDIPELGTAYANLRLSVQSGTPKSIQESYGILKKAILSSPDLLITNAKAIADDIYNQEVSVWLPEVTTRKAGPEMLTAAPIIPLDIPEQTPTVRKAPSTRPELIAAIGLTKSLSDADREAAKKIKVS